MKQKDFLHTCYMTLKKHIKVPHKNSSSNSTFQNIGLKGLSGDLNLVSHFS